ncbi:Protein GRIP [Abeliophyllum distichum]|uniref:Protein GRIP n=1 Tax=Abeliophyllum distichum TaxID=126358 RepID=A0ABD1VVT2_9LAMI
MDVERQQLRSANNRLQDNIEELHSSLVPKENALETLQQSLLEKEQMLEDVRWLLHAADEKRQSSIVELSLKHQKALVAERDSKIAEMDATSSGEVARLRAALETLKGELSHLKNEHEKERENREAASHSMRMKLETAESTRVRAEVEVAKMRSQLESELSVQTQRLNIKDAELDEDDQMNAEYSVAEDTMQSSAPSVPVFGQPTVSPSPMGFIFGSKVPSQPNPFLFAGQQNQVAPQNPSPFQPSASLEFNAGGSFSLGSGGGDKAGRKYVKYYRSKNRTKYSWPLIIFGVSILAIMDGSASLNTKKVAILFT